MPVINLPNGTLYNVNSLLADGDSNAKLTKSDKSAKGYLTFGLSLAPANTSGYQTCASSSPGCCAACLFTSGHGKMSNVQNARIAKTRFYFEQRDLFMHNLRLDIQAAERKAAKKNLHCAIRLNIVSDLMWETTGIIQEFPNIQFYDYTKHYKRMLNWCKDGLPSNYHLTFSRSEENEIQCLNILQNGGNVTVVFDNKALPKRWNSYKVINGDETDLRFLDPKNVVVGLYMKGDGKKDKTGFVVSLPVVK